MNPLVTISEQRLRSSDTNTIPPLKTLKAFVKQDFFRQLQKLAVKIRLEARHFHSLKTNYVQIVLRILQRL